MTSSDKTKLDNLLTTNDYNARYVSHTGDLIFYVGSNGVDTWSYQLDNGTNPSKPFKTISFALSISHRFKCGRTIIRLVDSITCDYDIHIAYLKHPMIIIESNDIYNPVNVNLVDKRSIFIQHKQLINFKYINFVKNFNTSYSDVFIGVHDNSYIIFNNCNFNVRDGFTLLAVDHGSYVIIDNTTISGSYGGIFNISSKSTLVIIGNIKFDNVTKSNVIGSDATFWCNNHCLVDINNANITGTCNLYYKFNLYGSSSIHNLSRGTSNIPGINVGTLGQGSYVE